MDRSAIWPLEGLGWNLQPPMIRSSRNVLVLEPITYVFRLCMEGKWEVALVPWTRGSEQVCSSNQLLKSNLSVGFKKEKGSESLQEAIMKLVAKTLRNINFLRTNSDEIHRMA